MSFATILFLLFSRGDHSEQLAARWTRLGDEELQKQEESEEEEEENQPTENKL